jgi:hypothetical protein
MITVQYVFDHPNIFTLLSFAPKKNKRVVSVHYVFRKKDRLGYWKRRNKSVLQSGKGWCGQSSNVQLVHHGKKDKPLANRLFYGMIDSAALNAFVIFTENISNFREYKKDKRKKFLKELALALVIPNARQRLLEVQQTPKDVKQVIRSCVVR